MPARTYILLLVALLLVACNAAENETSHSPSKAALKRATVRVHKHPLAPQTEPAPGQYCYIEKVYTSGDTNYIEADYIQFLMGKEAVTAARKKDTAETVLDDYYIVNENRKIRRLALAKNVLVQLVVAENGKLFLIDTAYTSLQRKLQNGIFILEIENGLVNRIQEQFLP